MNLRRNRVHGRGRSRLTTLLLTAVGGLAVFAVGAPVASAATCGDCRGASG